MSAECLGLILLEGASSVLISIFYDYVANVALIGNMVTLMQLDLSAWAKPSLEVV